MVIKDIGQKTLLVNTRLIGPFSSADAPRVAAVLPQLWTDGHHAVRADERTQDCHAHSL